MASSYKYVYLVAILSSMGVIGIVLVVLFGMGEMVTQIIAAIVGFLTPTISIILAIMIKDIHLDINSRMTELLETTRKSALAQGKLEANIQK
jgi:hypothetical protein